MSGNDASAGLSDDWIFYGDSITEGSLPHNTYAEVGGTSTWAQLINVAFGGSLYQDIPSHRSDDYEKHRHEIRFEAGSRLARLYPGTQRAAVSSIHHQSIKALGSYPDTITLPLLGRIKVTAVTLELRYTHPAIQGVQKAGDTTYWIRYHGTWKGLWRLADYQAYSHHRCPS